MLSAMMFLVYTPASPILICFILGPETGKIATLICVPAAELIVQEPLSIDKDMGTSYLALGAGRGLWTTFDHTLV